MQLQHDPRTGARIINANSTDTWLWSQSAAPGQPLTQRWPASAIAGHPIIMIVAESGDLLDYIGPSDALADELNAFQAYVLSQAPNECETCPSGQGHNRAETA